MRRILAPTCVALTLIASASSASEIQVSVTGVQAPYGQVGCGLHSNPSSFPTGHEGVPMQWVTPANGMAQCTFSDVAPGTYAVAVAHDLNGNRITDTTFIGLPTEQWGVSGNIRPALRAPRFEEAAFTVADAPVTLNIEIAK